MVSRKSTQQAFVDGHAVKEGRGEKPWPIAALGWVALALVAAMAATLFSVSAVEAEGPPIVEDGTLPASVSAGVYNTCALLGSAALCWGRPYTPPVLTPGADAFRQVEAGENFGCGLKIDGRVACWGLMTDTGLRPPADLVAAREDRGGPGPHVRGARQRHGGLLGR